MGLSKQVTVVIAFARIVLATPAPQQLDFDALAAAPTVASGPSINDGDLDAADQTASLFTSFTITAAITASSTTAANVEKRADYARDVPNSNSIISAYDASFGQLSKLTTVGPGVTHWINGGSTHNFFGNINNTGDIYVSQTQWLKTFPQSGGQTCDWVGHDANNGNLNNAAGASIILNDIDSVSAPTYDWYLRSIQNAGTIQWCGRGDTGGSTYQMYSDLDSVNSGLISFEQAFNNNGAAFVWRNPTLTTTARGANLYNNGAFRLVNVNYHNVQNVYGNGCWQIGKGGILYLEDGTGLFQNPTAGSSLPGQSISFQDASAVLHLDTAVYSRNSRFGAQIYGYGTGNAIEFYETIKSFSYSSPTLNVKFASGNSVQIVLGSGYVASNFVNRRNPQKYNSVGYNAIFYDGTPPIQSMPSVCAISVPTCSSWKNGIPSGIASSSAIISSSSVNLSTGRTSSGIATSFTSTSASTDTPFSNTAGTSAFTSALPTATTIASAILSLTSASGATTTTISGALPSIAISPTASSVIPTVSLSSNLSTGVSSGYTPYYPALATSYTTDPALSATVTSGQACPTQPEAGTYCGFINPLDPCAPQPDGYGPVPTPDSPAAFLAYNSLHSYAQAAPTTVPSSDGTQYTQVFKDLNASVSAQSYLGLYTFQSYDVAACAAKCDGTDLCTAFNIFAERDPSLNPSKDDSTAPTVWGYYCPNPPSMTSFRCTLWGSSIDTTVAANTGQWREDFQVVVTASDGYDKTNVTTPLNPSGLPATSSTISTGSVIATSSTASSVVLSASLIVPSSTISSFGASTSFAVSSSVKLAPSSASASASLPSGPIYPWSIPHNCNSKAISASAYWLGSRFFPGPFNPQVCSDYAISQNIENQSAGATQKCKMFNAYYLHKNDVPHGTYCSLYNSILGDSWATYSGGRASNGDKYTCAQSWTYSLK
nr:hypothetical protein CFP56_32126 [Quercus suber]